MWTTLNGHEAGNCGDSQEPEPTLTPPTCKGRSSGYGRRVLGESRPTPVSRTATARHDLRQDPGAVVPLARICAGGRPKGRLLPRTLESLAPFCPLVHQENPQIGVGQRVQAGSLRTRKSGPAVHTTGPPEGSLPSSGISHYAVTYINGEKGLRSRCLPRSVAATP